MVDEAFKRLPEAELFAADRGVAGAEARSEPPIGDALGIERPDEVPAERRELGHPVLRHRAHDAASGHRGGGGFLGSNAENAASRFEAGSRERCCGMNSISYRCRTLCVGTIDSKCRR